VSFLGVGEGGASVLRVVAAEAVRPAVVEIASGVGRTVARSNRGRGGCDGAPSRGRGGGSGGDGASRIGTMVAGGGAGCLALAFEVGGGESECEGGKGLVVVVSLAPVHSRHASAKRPVALTFFRAELTAVLLVIGSFPSVANLWHFLIC
jgi:hypothetical protein